MNARLSTMLFLLGMVTFTFAQNFEADGVCQPVFDNGGQNDGAAGYLSFDVSAGEDAFFVSDLEFVADVSGEFNVSQVLVFEGSIFSPDLDRNTATPLMIVSANDNLTLTTVAGQSFRLGFTSSMAFEVSPNSIVGIQVSFENRLQTANPPLARFSLAANTQFNATENGDIVRQWGSLSVSSGLVFTDERIDNVVFHGGVCVTNLDQQTFVASLDMTSDAVRPPITLVDASANATCTVIFDQNSYEVSFRVEFTDLSSSPVEIGLYLPATAEESVSQLPTFPIPAADLANLGTSGQVESSNDDVNLVEFYRINPTQRDLLFDGLWYCEIATANNPDGELRAQVENFVEATQTTQFPLTVQAVEVGLDGDFEETITLTQRGQLVAGASIDVLVPGATATAVLSFQSQEPNENDNRIDYEITYSGLSGPVTSAELRRAARNTDVGEIVVKSLPLEDNAGNAGVIEGILPRLSPDETQDALDGLWYLVLATEQNPMGEIRAQVNRAQATVIASTGTGFATITTNSADRTLRLQVEYSGLSSEVIAAEIRGAIQNTFPAEDNEEGISLIVVLSAESRSEQGDGSSGVLSGVTQLSQGILNQLRDNNLYYVLLRTTANPDSGELRGSIPTASINAITPPQPQTFTADVPLSVEAEINALDENSDMAPLGVPDTLLNANSTGRAVIRYDAVDGVITWNIDYANLSSPLVAAHLHGAAGVTDTAGVRVNIPVTDANGMVLPSPLIGSIQISDNMAREALGGFWYVNLHTANNPMTGELRGQLVPNVGAPQVVIETPPPQIQAQRAGPIPLTRAASINSGVMVVPAEDAQDNIGSATVTLYRSNSTISWEIEYGTLSSPVTLIHFHGPALATETAGVRVTVYDGNVGNNANPNIGSAVLPDPAINDALADELMRGLWYINIHTENNPMGELRGQVTNFQQIAVDLEQPDIPVNTDVVAVDDNSSTSSSISLLTLAAAALIGSISTF